MNISEYLDSEHLPISGCSNYFIMNQSDIDVYFRSSGVSAPAVGIAYKNLDGTPMQCLDSDIDYIRMRCLNEDDITNGKYRSISGCSGFRVYIPTLLKEAFKSYKKKDLVITEGEKKADICCSYGIPCIALSGVHMWFDPMLRNSHNPLDENVRIHSDILDIIQQFDVKRVLVLFDSDGAPIPAKALSQSYLSSCTTLKYPKGHVVKNIQVYKSATIIVQAIKAQTELSAAFNYCPPSISKLKSTSASLDTLDKNANVIVGKVGLDDWFASTSPDVVCKHISEWLDSAKKGIVKSEVDDESYIPLGISPDGTHLVIWNKEVDSLFEVNMSKLTSGPSLLQCIGSKSIDRFYVYNEQTGRKVLDIMAGVRDLYDKCKLMGTWSAQSHMRGSGVWRHKNNLIVNGTNKAIMLDYSSGVAHETELSRCEIGRSLVLSKSSKGLIIEDDLASEQDWVELMNVLGSWSWRSVTDAWMFCGWLLQQSFTGALHYRTHVFLTGESGAGKTVLLNLVSLFLSDTAKSIDHGSDSSPAGLRQLLDRDAVTLILDEFEPSTSEHSAAQRRKADSVAGILQMLRAAYSAIPDNDGDSSRSSVVKGSSSGKAQEFSLYTSVLMAGISVSSLEQADLNRMLILQISPIKNGSPPDINGMLGIGRRIRRTLWNHWTEYDKILHITQKHISRTTGWDSRKCWTWSTPIACMVLMQVIRGSVSEKDYLSIVAELSKVVIEKSVPTAGVDVMDTVSDHDRILSLWLSQVLDVETRETVDSTLRVTRDKQTLECMVNAAIRVGVGSKSRASSESDEALALHKYGMSVKKDDTGSYIFLSYNNVVIQRMATRLAVSNIHALLSRVKGSYEGRASIYGSRKRGLWVPLGLDEADDN